MHCDAPAAEYVPKSHNGVALFPSQREPAGQIEHVSRLLELGPVVYEPAVQVRHPSAWPACEYLLSAPQAVQESAPAVENVPFGHVETGLLPSHLEPAGQVLHMSAGKQNFEIELSISKLSEMIQSQIIHTIQESKFHIHDLISLL